MEMKTVALIGAGAVGAYFIDCLADVLGEDFCVVAEGSRAKRLKEKGLMINGHRRSLRVKTPEEARGCDLLLTAVKHSALDAVLPQIQTMVEEHTTVISLLNGIDSEERIASVIGSSHLLYAVMKISSVRQGDAVVYDPERTIGVGFGEKNGAHTERVRAVEALFDRTPLHYYVPEDTVAEIWSKYEWNVSHNLPQAVLGVGYQAYLDSEHVAFLRDALMTEVRNLADSYGIRYTSMQVPPQKPGARFSTLQDLDAKRHTEVDMFLGVLIKKSEEQGLQAPYASAVYHMIKALEEKNDGMFDYF